MTIKSKFKALLVVTFSTTVASALAYHYVDRENLPIDLQHYLHTKSIQILSLHYSRFVAESLAYFVFSAISFVGLYLFWRPARIIYCGSIGISVLMIIDPNYSPDIATRWAGALDFCNLILTGMILCLIFTSPVRELFNNRKN